MPAQDEPRVIIYTTDWCPFCNMAKRLLDQRQVRYKEELLDTEGRQRLRERTGMMTVPQIFIDDQLVGGFHELVLLDRQQGLARLMSE